MSSEDSALRHVIDLGRAFWKSKALLVASKLDVFEAISDAPRTAGEVAATIGADTRATEVLLDALASLKVIRKEGIAFANTPASLRFLRPSSPDYIGFALRHYNHCWDAWSQLEEVLRTGLPERSIEMDLLRLDVCRARDFTRKMDYTARRMAPELEQKIDFGGVGTMLDLGGGSGYYSVYFARKHPSLRCTVYELPLVASIVEETVRRENLSERVSVIAGDFLTDSIPGSYDLALASFLFHAFAPPDVLQVLGSLASILREGGTLAVQEYAFDSAAADQAEAAIFSLLMLVCTRGGRTYTPRQLEQLLRQAGLRPTAQRLEARSPFIVGRNPYLFLARREEPRRCPTTPQPKPQ